MISLAFRNPPPPGSPPWAPAGLEQSMEAATVSAAVELLGAYGVPIKPVSGIEAQAPITDLVALGVVRFTAPGLTGTAILGAATTTLRRSNTRGTTDRDWVAELANQFIGRFKLKLLREGFELWSMAPVAVSGRLLLTAVSQPGFAPTRFRDPEGGTLAIWIEIEISAPLKMGNRAADGEVPHEGDVILF